MAALIKDCRYATARGCAQRAERLTTVIFLQLVIYFGRAFPNWKARVIPTIAISGFLAFVSKNPICFSDGSMSKIMKLQLGRNINISLRLLEQWSDDLLFMELYTV